MLIGCQRRSQVFCCTDGLTQLTGHIPNSRLSPVTTLNFEIAAPD
jgi:hypothetical protein